MGVSGSQWVSVGASGSQWESVGVSGSQWECFSSSLLERQVVAQLAKALSWEAVDCGFESHQNLNLLQIFLQNHTKMAGISNIIIGW